MKGTVAGAPAGKPLAMMQRRFGLRSRNSCFGELQRQLGLVGLAVAALLPQLPLAAAIALRQHQLSSGEHLGTLAAAAAEEMSAGSTGAESLSQAGNATGSVRSYGDASAVVQQGQDLKIYLVGSSNLVWMTWPDQMHAMLRRLGFSIVTPTGRVAHRLHPEWAPTCDDITEYQELDTSRIGGKSGWASWDYAYDSREDCDHEGFRTIAGHRIRCLSGWGCASAELVRVSDIAQEAKGSHAVVLSNWVNDARQFLTGFVCFGGKPLSPMDTVNITLTTLRQTIRRIHEEDPNVLVIVLATYPTPNLMALMTGGGTEQLLTVSPYLLPTVNQLNAAMRDGLANEPKTVFANYTFPLGETLFQTLHAGHPNCRGDKVIATAVVETLFKQGIISHGLDVAGEECLARADCQSLTPACCRRSALCWAAYDGSCGSFGPGRQ